MINTIFDLCVDILIVLAGWLDISYQAINVWIFVIVWPLVTLALLAIVIWQWRKLRQNALDSQKNGDIFMNTVYFTS